MGLSSVSEVAQVINNLSSEQQDIKESYADEGDASFLLAPFETVTCDDSGSIIAHYLGTSSFYLDHPVYGDIDSSILHIDGDYASTSVLYSSIEV